jgi:hypothetical protein
MQKAKSFFFILTTSLVPFAAHAQDIGGNDVNKAAVTVGGYTEGQSVEGLVGTVITAFLGLLGVIFLVLMVYGGYIWLIARGDEAKVEKAKDTIINSMIGLIIVLAAYAITYFVLDKLISSTVTV